MLPEPRLIYLGITPEQWTLHVPPVQTPRLISGLAKSVGFRCQVTWSSQICESFMRPESFLAELILLEAPHMFGE